MRCPSQLPQLLALDLHVVSILERDNTLFEHVVSFTERVAAPTYIPPPVRSVLKTVATQGLLPMSPRLRLDASIGLAVPVNTNPVQVRCVPRPHLVLAFLRSKRDSVAVIVHRAAVLVL